MNILILTSWGSALPSVMSGYARAFETLGHRVLSIDMRALEVLDGQREAVSRFVDDVRTFSPDLALFYGTLGVISTQRPGINFFESLGIPYVSIFGDNPFMYLQALNESSRAGLLASSRYYAFCTDPVYAMKLKSFGVKRCEYLPLATDPELFVVDQSQVDRERFSSPVVFVGNIREDLDQVRSKRRERWSKYPAIQLLIEDIVDFGKTSSTLDVSRKLARLENAMPWESYALLCRTVYEETSTLHRLQVVMSVADQPVAVYGGNGWKKAAGPAVEYRGSIDYARELPQVYALAEIVLNVTHPQLIEAVNQRVYDVPAAGGFVLSDFRADLDRHFGSEMPAYNSMDDMNDKIRYFIKHDDERREMADAARARVLERHTWRHRAEELLTQI
jgi:spore maturation protein CgeB